MFHVEHLIHTTYHLLYSAHAFTMYFLDSHAYPESDDQDGYDFIKSEQLDWIIHSASTFNKLPSKPNAAAFFHIPIW